MRVTPILFATIALALPLRAATFESGETQTALLELYTSEGCSSCPPAEARLGKLRDDPGLWKQVVPVAFHVDYWDRLGWPDRFASPAFARRQYDYAARWGTGSVYTPGFVQNGREGTGAASNARPGRLRAEVGPDGKMNEFLPDLLPPLYTFLRRRGHPPSDAQDLTQAFFAHLLEQNTLTRASREKGRLRTFPPGSPQHFLANEHAHRQAFKRGGGKQIVSMDDHLIEAGASMLHTAPTDAANGYDRQWAANLVSRAWDELRQTMIAEGKRDLIEALKPFVIGGTASPPDQEETAARLRMPISTFRNAPRRLRLRYRESLRTEVARTVSTVPEIDEELQYLFRLLLA